jgi:23S rRNA pseudouridine1911/1915/1917 synthase
MKYLGHPLFADETYGGMQLVKQSKLPKFEAFIDNCFKICPRQALHAKTLGFVHPKTQEMMRFNTELPNDMQELIEKWRGYANSNAAEPDEE